MLQIFLGYLIFSTLLATTEAQTAKVLIYSATREFRHDSIPTAIRILNSKGPGNTPRIQFDNTEDQTQFNDATLAQYDAILFLMTTGEVLDDPGKQAFQSYLNKGGNFIVIHSASDSLRTTTFYGNELGAWFDYHPALQNGTVLLLDSNNPSTSMLPQRWNVQDEFYNFKRDPRSVGAQVILSVDESTYTDNGTRRFDQGTPHPIAWFQDHGAGASSPSLAGRSWYTSLGHLNETWETGLYIQHVMGGISWTLLSNTTKAFNSTALVGNGQSSGSTTGTGTGTGTASLPSSTSHSSSGITSTSSNLTPSSIPPASQTPTPSSSSSSTSKHAIGGIATAILALTCLML